MAIGPEQIWLPGKRHCSTADSSAEILHHVAVDSGFLSLVDLMGEGLPESGIMKYGIWPSKFFFLVDLALIDLTQH